MYNTFIPLSSNILDKTDEKKYDIILDHVKTNLCGGKEKEYEIVIDYLSHKFQNINKKVKKCMIFVSLPGIGKNIFFSNLITKILGERYVFETASLDSVVGKFNNCMSDKLLVILNEAQNTDSSNSGYHKKNQILIYGLFSGGST